MSAGWDSASFAELESIPLFDGIVWHPVRRRFGIRAFGTNAYTAEAVGEQIVEEHDEAGGGSPGHEELYVVVSGRAVFTVGGDEIDAPSGTLVFISDPALKRKAIAVAEGTVVLAVGAEPGVAYEPSAWEWYFAAMPAMRERRYPEAIALMEDGLRERPGNPSLLYNLACAESLAGRPLDAITHLRAAVEGAPKFRERALADPDFDPIRREQGFPH